MVPEVQLALKVASNNDALSSRRVGSNKDGPIGTDTLAGGGNPPHGPGAMDENRLSRLEGSYDALKVVRPMTITVLSVMLAALVLVLGFLSVQLAALGGRVDAQVTGLNGRMDGLTAKIDAIPSRLTDEFRAMRADMAAQTSAIANSITATKQVQPQIMVLPPSPSLPTGTR